MHRGQPRRAGGKFLGWAVRGKGFCHPIAHVGAIINHWLTYIDRHPRGGGGGGSAAPAPLHTRGGKLPSYFPLKYLNMY